MVKSCCRTISQVHACVLSPVDAADIPPLLYPPCLTFNVPFHQVGIVTPYRGQRDLIRNKLVDMFGPQELSRVRVETIDSFQGKQLDVVILSLVRASSGGNQGGSNRGPFGDRRGTPPLADPTAAAAAASGTDGRQMLPLNRAGVGFLSDVRRMNVAITRARLACLILGRVDTLQQDAAWSALVADAAARGCLFKVSIQALMVVG